MISIFVNNQVFLVKSTLNLIEACKYTGIVLPRFCYHEKLSIAANCRMCLVEIGGMAKPVTACSHFIVSNLSVFTNTPFVKKARENILEILLLNHPLDCPICDQGGECDLQDQVKTFGSFYSRFYLSIKRKVKNKKCSPLIKTIMTRCIHCTRCVRFGAEIAGVELLGTLNRGVSTEIGGYLPKLLNSEVSGNVIDLCPVGALTPRAYHFNVRPWELETIKTIDTLDSLGANIYFQVKKSKIIRVLPKNNSDLNENWISDKTRFSIDSLISKNRIKIPAIFNNNLKKNSLSKSKLDLSVNVNEITTTISNVIDYCLDTKTTTNQNVDLPRISFLINENADLELLFFLKNLQKLNKNISVYSTEYKKFLNFDLSWQSDKIKSLQSDIKNCFLFTSNIRVENALIHIKLYVKSLNKNFKVTKFGLPNKAKFPVSVVNLNLQNSIKFFEGKEFLASKKLLSKQVLFLFGQSFFNRCSFVFLNFLSFLKLNFPTALVFKVDGNSNTTSFDSLGIKSYNSKKFELSNTIVCNNLENFNIKTKSIFKKISNLIQYKRLYFLFHSHENKNVGLNFFSSKYLKLKTSTTVNSIFVLPALTSIEFEGVYVNLEGRPQKTQIIKTSNSKTILLKELLKKFVLNSKDFILSNDIKCLRTKNVFYGYFQNFFNIKSFDSIKELMFIFEILKNYTLFNHLKKDFSSSLYILFGNGFLFSKFSKSSLKFRFENFYTQTNYLYNSNNMQNYQQKINKLFENF